MSFDSHANLASSTVATAPSPATSGTSLVVATGQGSRFPTAPFNATVWPANTQPTPANAEIVRVTAVSTDTFTITRAQESTTARSIGVGDQIAATITAKTLTDIEKAAGLLHTVSSSGSSLSISYSTASTWDITLSANCTFSLSGFTSGDPDFLTLIIRQDGTGSRTVTWPTITWIGTGVAPTLQTAASSVDSVVLFSVDGGTTVYGIAQTSASGIASGTSFPGSPSGGDLFYRTDTRILYEYNSTATKWLSMDRKFIPFSGDQLNGGTTVGTEGRIPLLEDLYIEKWVAHTFTAATNNGSNSYTYTLYKIAAPNSATSITSVSTSSDTAASWTAHSVSVGAVVSASSYSVLSISSTKTGTPGNHFGTYMIVARSVG